MAKATLPPLVRSRATARTNRTGIALTGLLLLVAGSAAIAAALGAFGTRVADEPVITSGTTRFVERSTWFWPVVALVAVVLALLGLRWLAVQLRSSRLARLDLEPDRRDGETVLHTAALTAALTDEIESYRGVAGSRADLLGDSASPRLALRVDLDGRADPGEVRRRIETQALAHARAALGHDVLPARVELRLAARRWRQPR